MKTPDTYNSLIESRVITTELAADVIYSLNKRAKNWRDSHPEKYREMRDLRITGGSIEKMRKRYGALDYYRDKDFIIISLFMPQKIHIINGIEYLYYRVHHSVFHLPLYVYRGYGLTPPSGLKKEKGDNSVTSGEEKTRLLSLQFCRRVIELVKQGGFILIEGGIIHERPASILTTWD